MEGTQWLQAAGETLEHNGQPPKRVAVSFGPDYAPLEQRQVERAIEEAFTTYPKPEILVFAAFQFDPEAAKDIDVARVGGTVLLKTQMNPDLLTGDLKRNQAGNDSFWLVGQPDISITPATSNDQGDWVVEVQGFDYFDPTPNTIQSGGPKEIACWMLDTDYNGRSLYPRQVFFPQGGKKQGWDKLAKALRVELNMDRVRAYAGTRSLAFCAGDHRRIAVKIVDLRGVESLKVLDVPDIH